MGTFNTVKIIDLHIQSERLFKWLLGFVVFTYPTRPCYSCSVNSGLCAGSQAQGEEKKEIFLL